MRYYLVLFLISIFLVFRNRVYPPFWLFLYLWINLNDSFGFAASIPSIYPYLFISAGFVASTILSVIKIYNQEIESKYKSRLKTITVLIGLYSLWVYLSIIIQNPSNYLCLVLPVDFSGPFSMLIVFAYYRDSRARLLFFLYIFTQVVLAALILYFPGGVFNVFSAANHSEIISDMESTAVLQFSDKESLYGSRVSAQFLNTIQLSFYGAVALAVGLYLLKFSKKILNRSYCFILIFIGFWLQLITVTRGIIAGLVFGYLIILMRIRGIFRLGLILLVILFISKPLITFMSTLDISPELQPTLGRFQDIKEEFSSESYRGKAITEFIDHIDDFIIFGYGSYYRALDKFSDVLPHQAPLSITATYGVVAGFLVMVFLILGISSSINGRRVFLINNSTTNVSSDFLTNDRINLFIVLGWLVMFVAMSNGLAGITLNWIVLAIAMLFWVEK